MSKNSTHELYMNRCIEIAKKGIGSTYPNPCVGCIIVYDNKILSEAYSSEYGGSHAEINAINKVKNKENLKKSTLYVTLEPCSHYGKTPPCCDAIVKHKISKVVIGKSKVDDQVLDNLEEILISSDVGVKTTLKIIIQC